MNKTFFALRAILGMRGICATIFGIIFVWPGVTIASLAGLYAAYAVARGGLTVAVAMTRQSSRTGRWIGLSAGIVSVAAGAAAYTSAELTAARLMWIIGVNETLLGITEIALAFNLRKAIADEWSLVAAACLSMALGILMLLVPPRELLAMTSLMGVYAIIHGAMLCVMGLRRAPWSAPRLQPGGPDGAGNTESETP
jgi:uncharacterized membrane protein HdeD (DUF308 family)